MELSISLPLDVDGFLDRACENYERHFCWKHMELYELEGGGNGRVTFYRRYCWNEAGPSNTTYPCS